MKLSLLMMIGILCIILAVSCGGVEPETVETIQSEPTPLQTREPIQEEQEPSPEAVERGLFC